jgi:hypothetical protein
VNLNSFSTKKSFLLSQKGFVVGVAGFEPAASCSQSRRDNRATLHPEASAKISFNFTWQNDLVEINLIYFRIDF